MGLTPPDTAPGGQESGRWSLKSTVCSSQTVLPPRRAASPFSLLPHAVPGPGEEQGCSAAWLRARPALVSSPEAWAWPGPSSPHAKEAVGAHLGLLRQRRQRQRCRGAREQQDPFTPAMGIPPPPCPAWRHTPTPPPLPPYARPPRTTFPRGPCAHAAEEAVLRGWGSSVLIGSLGQPPAAIG